MFDQNGEWVRIETFDEFDNGLSDLIDLWSSTVGADNNAVRESALAHFRQDLEAAALKWAGNKAKSKKYAAIGKELAEFEAVLTEDLDFSSKALNISPEVFRSPKLTG